MLTVLPCLVFPAVGMLGPRNLLVSDEWYTRFRVSWDPAPSRVTGYKIIYQAEGVYMLLLLSNAASFLILHLKGTFIKSRGTFLLILTHKGTFNVYSQALMSRWRCLLET